MKMVAASAEIIQATHDLEQLLELAGRVCYKSEDRITADSACGFIGRMHDSKHESVLEHAAISVRFVCDRGVSHELVRHRIASFSQESTRYCNYSKDKFGREITVIDPRGGFPNMTLRSLEMWEKACRAAEYAYFSMLEAGSTPQEARSVLPNSLKTELVMTTNPREWRHVFRQRCSSQAHPQMREVMNPLQREFAQRWPALFEEL